MRDLMDVSVRQQRNPRRQMLTGIFRVLDESGAAWCLSHGHDIFADHAPTDIDCIVDAALSPRKLVELLVSRQDEIGARVMQWLSDGSQWIVLANDDAPPVILQLHVCFNYELNHRVYYPGRRLLERRIRHEDYWIAAPAIEFGCLLVNRVYKGRLDQRRRKRMSDLFELDPPGCMVQIERFFMPTQARALATAARTREWDSAAQRIPELREDLESRRPTTGRLAFWKRRLKRWAGPKHGMHLVFLGSDGAGKSTVIEAVRHELSNAFLRTDTFDFAPSFVPPPLQPEPRPPHELPPRSFPASLVKAAWWSLVYGIGYRTILRRARARATLILNHRYLLDAIVDPKRYRYSGPAWLLKALWKIACKPDLVILLDADPQIIHERKKDLSLEEITRQRGAYRALVEPLSYGRIVDASQPLSEVVAAVNRLVLDQMAMRIKDRLSAEVGT